MTRARGFVQCQAEPLDRAVVTQKDRQTDRVRLVGVVEARVPCEVAVLPSRSSASACRTTLLRGSEGRLEVHVAPRAWPLAPHGCCELCHILTQ